MVFWIVLVELIGSIYLAIAFVSAIVLMIVHVKKRRNAQTATNQSDSSAVTLPFGEFNRIRPPFDSQSKATNTGDESATIHVISEEETSSRRVKYGIQWALPLSKDQQIEADLTNKDIPTLNALISKQTAEFDQGDSLSFGDDSTMTFSSVRNLIQKFENSSSSNSVAKYKSLTVTPHRPLGTRQHQTEKNNQTDADVASIETGELDLVGNIPIKIDHEQSVLKDLASHHSSISNLDVTVPSNLSSSIDLEQFNRNEECFSTTSNLSEYLNSNQLFGDR